MSLWPFEDYYWCEKHNRHWPCSECSAIAERERHQREHEDSVRRQKRKLKILNEIGPSGEQVG